ncbi:hypothetical protein [Hymenobacter perfusus]|uniref:Apolipoprotein N-acyltransferase n=1 Tax=Hymenobacter perfusus TaxID=1236770 RepID=A0A3R9MI23_9BACT|nr:hypothetical protein [Hymenobacter perfusus]RSK42753.1 hypothetical protein EI293_13210 [Hymenobacter perfusus]
MKSFGLLFLLVLLACALVQLFLPWWMLVPVCLLLAAWRNPSGGRAFVAGLLGAGFSWWLPAAWLASHGAGLLATRVAMLLPLGGSTPLLVLVSGLLAGIVGGLACLSGTWLRRAVAPKAAPQSSL